MSAFRGLAQKEAGQLREFRESEHARLMIKLVQTECLLELAKLSSTGLDMATYTNHVVDVLEQLLPLHSCAVYFDVEGIPPIRAVRGDFVEGVVSVSAPLNFGAQAAQVPAVGAVQLSFGLAEVGDPEFATALAEQISTGLSIVVETERLRRDAALAETSQLVAALSDDPTAEALQRLAEAISYLPNVIGVALEIVHPVVGSQVELTAGLRTTQDWTTTSVDGGFIRSAIAWADGALLIDVELVANVIDQIGHALAKADERRRLMKEAETDPLTGVANRRRAMQALEMSLALAKMNDDTLAVVSFDLDKFKQVNDRFGHDAGDDVLVRFASHLRSSVRRSDIVARLGGEEFLLLCPGLDERTGQRILQAIIDNTPDACKSELAPDWRQTASAGLAVYPVAGVEPEQLLRASDRAMYSAKHLGGNAVGYAALTE